MEKDKVEDTDVISFKFNKHDDYYVENKTLLDYTAGQFAFFDIGEVYHDPKVRLGILLFHLLLLRIL